MAEDQLKFTRFLAECPDDEVTCKLVTERMKMRDIARLKSLARKLDTKYQTLMLELIVERLDRLEAEIKAKAKPVSQAVAQARGENEEDNLIEMVQHLSATRPSIDALLDSPGL